MNKQKTLLAVTLVATLAVSARAAVIISADEVGPDVVFSYNGSINLTGNTGSTDHVTPVMRIDPSGPQIVALSAANYTAYDMVISGPATFGTGGQTDADSGTGDNFYVLPSSDVIAVPIGYTSGDPLSGSITFDNTDLTTLGVNTGTYVWTLPNDTITLNVVPEPATYAALLGLAALGFVCARRRRR